MLIAPLKLFKSLLACVYSLKFADSSPFVNEIFSPEFSDLIFNQKQNERERLLNEYHNTHYSVVDIPLIERIYGILYRQKVSGVQRHRYRCLNRVVKACTFNGCQRC